MNARRRRGVADLAVISAVVVAVLAGDLFGVGAAGASAPVGPGPEATVSIVVTGDSTLSAATVGRVTGGAGRITDTIDAIGATVVEVPASAAAVATRRLDAVPGVDSARRDGEVRAFDVTPDDTYWAQQESLRTIGAPAAWSTSTGSSSVVVAIVDSGVDEVPDLAGRVLPGYDFVNGDADAADDFDHGTAAALVAAAEGNDGFGAAGLCWTCLVLPVKVLDADGAGVMSDVADGIVWATDHGADVINLSLGGPDDEPAVTAALQYAFAHDVVVVASAGNDGRSDRSYPAAAAGVVSVTGISTPQRTLHPLGRRGPTWVDLAAPWCNWVVLSGPGTFCGTSSAAPVVSGIAALARAARPAADRQMVATALLTTADFPPTAGLVGYGIVDAGRTLGAIGVVAPGPTPPPPDVTAPTVSMSVPGGFRSGVVTVRVSARDDQALSVNEVRLDGRLVSALANPAPEQDMGFDSAFFADGTYQLEAATTDGAGHRATSAPSPVVIDNTNPLGLLTSPTQGARVTGPFVARVFVTDPNGIMGTFLIANDQVIGGFQGAGWGEATVPVTRSGPIRVVALTVDRAGRISGTNTAVVTAAVPRRRARR